MKVTEIKFLQGVILPGQKTSMFLAEQQHFRGQGDASIEIFRDGDVVWWVVEHKGTDRICETPWSNVQYLVRAIEKADPAREPSPAVKKPAPKKKPGPKPKAKSGPAA